MKRYLKVLIFGFFQILIVQKAFSQEVIDISKDMFSNNGELHLDQQEGWLFKLGNNPDWANVELDTRDWEKLTPKELSVDLADEDGRLEGWFRIQIKINPELSNTELYFYQRSHEATDIYLNGTLLKSFGKIGPDIQSYEAYIDNKKLPIPISFVADSVYTLAFHVLDYSDLYPIQLRGSFGQSTFFALGNSNYFNERASYWENDPLFKSIWITTGILLAFLFWFLWFLNKSEKTLQLIAITSTLSLLCPIAMILFDKENISFEGLLFGTRLFLLAISTYLIFMPLVVSQIFKGTISSWLKYLVAALMTMTILNTIFLFNVTPLVIIALLTTSLNIYFIVSYWRRLKGAQWAILGGIVSTALLFIILLMIVYLVQIGKFTFTVQTLNWVTTGAFLAFPLSMLIYVAIRFQEIIQDIRLKANELVKISEEKQELLTGQNQVLEEQVEIRTRELVQAKVEVEKSLENLKSTQAQLIQSEKMASLGELTAGIAHEIQNPLNFVNNFSEINRELVGEALEELDKGDIEETKSILNDLGENSEKITLHGKRADTIVKGMLEHSRTNKGEKALTDLNALAEEFLKLSYHGFRAKDKSFSADFKLDLDPDLPKVNVVASDIGRVILNLVNNAFYAVNEEAKSSPKDFKPEVLISSKQTEKGIEISVKDNGDGIPEHIKEKIFQPFFTTKPTGSGTGLGLSLSYDIVKAHGGELRVESKEGKGAIFTISITLMN